MSSARPNLAIIAACLVALAAGVAVFLLRPGAQPDNDDTAQVGSTPAGDNERLPAGLKLAELDGRAFSLDDYRGKLLIVNFWATWCAPCLHEIPVLVQMQARYGAKGLQIIGPAVDDIEDTRRAAPGLQFNYPVAVGTPEDILDLMTKLGNEQGGLPFSVAIAADGRVLERQLGEYSEAELVALIEKNLPR